MYLQQYRNKPTNNNNNNTIKEKGALEMYK